jgi:hypothetical protein
MQSTWLIDMIDLAWRLVWFCVARCRCTPMALILGEGEKEINGTWHAEVEAST